MIQDYHKRENGTLWFEGGFTIRRTGSMHYPVFDGDKSFNNGFEYNENGEQIRTYLEGKPIAAEH